ncbi:MAG: extracellular solute-binding protein [Paenibacillaceae bacterium]|nr:extracellular solute-binding protein [Paenibacillaceae bacterium]
MNKKLGKQALTSSLLVLAAGSLLLSACSNKEEKGAASPSTGASTSAAASATPVATKGPKPKISVSIYDRNNVPEGEGTITDNRWTKWINENAPVQVDFISVPRNNSSEKWNVLFASNQAPDLILEFSNPYMKDLAAKGQIIPLDDAIAKYSTAYKKVLDGNPNLQKLTRYNGKTFFIARLTPFTTNHFLMIRKDWLDKLQLQMPKTTEEYVKVAQAFADQDPDGNGKKDTFGSTFFDIDYFFGLGQSSTESMSISSYFLQNDQYVRTWEQPKANIALKKQLYDAGVVDKDIFADKNGAKAQQDFVNGKLGIWGTGGLEGSAGYSAYQTLMKNDPNAKVAILPLPKSEFGQFSPAGGGYMQFTAAINATAKNVEAVMKYVDWMMSDEVQKTLAYGFEGVHYKMGADGCPKPIDAEKNKKELSWNGDFQMLSQTRLMGKCVEFSNTLDASKPLDKAYLDLIQQGRDAYISADRPTSPAVVLPVTLTDDLVVINNTAVNTITNIYTKAIVGGTGYSVDQAMKDAKDAWEKAGGKKVDDFYAKAYTDNKKDVILTKDYYNYLKK